jgi:CheY-like chemotaxis protein
MKNNDKIEPENDYGRQFVRYQDLMSHRINSILLVSSLYDSFILGEDGHLYEMLLSEYMGLNLSHTPGITRVSGGREALEMIGEKGGFDLIITTLRLADMHALDFARELRKNGNAVPLVLLTYDNRELNELVASHDVSCFDKVFMWQGNFRILLAIIKCIEDILNVERDTRIAGVQSIILIEDNVRFYSSYLPIIYTELMRHTQNVIAEGINLAHKLLRMRARPKILLCENYELAWNYYKTYHETVLGVISDAFFPRRGESDPSAGVEFAKAVKNRHPDIPILLQSDNPEYEQRANEVGASFLLKNSPTLLSDLQKFIIRNFNFGDFIFRLPDGAEVGRARDLRELEQKIYTIPDESLLYHGARNDFSNWLKARTEFFLAHKLRPHKVSDYSSLDEVRRYLISCLREYHVAQHRGTIIDFDPDTFDPSDSFARIGGGSLGGKGRGLAFGNSMINNYHLRDRFDGINIAVPPTVILGADVFDHFIEYNELSDFALSAASDEEIVNRFLNAEMPDYVLQWLQDLLRVTKYPLAVRSSSLLEDSQYQPFAGVYNTYMIPNSHHDLEVRLVELLSAVKRVYASTYTTRARHYIKATSYRLEEEKMAVIIQKLVGQQHNGRFYPDISGVARSHNFYPISPMNSEDGITSVALGLGIIVMEGGATVRFCPKYPRHLVQFSSVEDSLAYSQKEFYALGLLDPAVEYDPQRESTLLKLGLDTAEEDNVLGAVGSTYSPEDHAIYDGIARSGIRIVNFAPILKNDFFPLAEVLLLLTDLSRRGMSTPVELEFSVNLSVPSGQPKEFRLLQLRPMVISHEREQLEIGNIEPEKMVCRSGQVLGNGLIDSIYDVIVVDKDRYDRAKSVEVAREIGLYNLELEEKSVPYLLIGVGRWGSADPWLGIPVNWDDITGARVIVESDFKDMKVTPSQGTHFFQNLTAFDIGYFTVSSDNCDDFVDWKWLSEQTPIKKRAYIRHLKFDNPLIIKMNGHKNEGIIIKPDSGQS